MDPNTLFTPRQSAQLPRATVGTGDSALPLVHVAARYPRRMAIPALSPFGVFWDAMESDALLVDEDGMLLELS